MQKRYYHIHVIVFCLEQFAQTGKSLVHLHSKARRRAATSVVELWPGAADYCEPLHRSFGALFSFEERLSLDTVFVTIVDVVASEPEEGAFSPFFCNLVSRSSDFFVSLVP